MSRNWLKKSIRAVGFRVPSRPRTPQASALMLSRPSAPPTRMPRGSFMPSMKAEAAARGSNTRREFLWILRTRSIVLLFCDPEELSEACDDAQEKKDYRKPGRTVEKTVKAVADGQSDEGRKYQVESYGAGLKQLPEKRFLRHRRTSLFLTLFFSF